MRICENHPIGGQLIHVGRFGLRVALQHASPVIEIIDGDEQNIWLSAWLVGVLCFTRGARHAEH